MNYPAIKSLLQCPEDIDLVREQLKKQRDAITLILDTFAAPPRASLSGRVQLQRRGVPFDLDGPLIFTLLGPVQHAVLCGQEARKVLAKHEELTKHEPAPYIVDEATPDWDDWDDEDDFDEDD